MFQHFLEWLLGLEQGFLHRGGGDYTFAFMPDWPWQKYTGAAIWNLALGVAAIVLVWWVYRRDGRSRLARVLLGLFRLALLGLVLALLNRPGLTLSTTRHESGVVAIVMDDTLSMKVPDMPSPGGPESRLHALIDLVGGDKGALIDALAKRNNVKFYKFDQSAQELVAPAPASGAGAAKAPAAGSNASTTRPSARPDPYAGVIAQVMKLKPVGQTTQITSSLRSVLESLQGQRVAGVIVLTDGRDVPGENLNDAVNSVSSFKVPIYSVVIGSDKAPRDIDVEAVSVQDSAFKGDIVDVKATIRAAGYEANHAVRVVLRDKRTGQPLRDSSGQPVDREIHLVGDAPQVIELPFKASDIGTLNFVVDAMKQPGEINEENNTFDSQVDVLDAKINLLYVEGYPRWEYRNIKNEMIREPTINVSCLLQSADTGFIQEHGVKDDPRNTKYKYFPYRQFPTTMEQLMESDVVLFGDVDPQQFTDAQLALVRDFVATKKGGFGMIAGTRHAPQDFRNTPIQDILPVGITHVTGESWGDIVQGFRPVITQDGENSSIFRFFEDRKRNDDYLRNDLQLLFWYCRGVTVKPNVGEVYAEHPFETGPDGRKAPLLVLGHFGSGRTLFSAIDDSWRWRYYTGESIFNTYWVQQIRYLAREKKLGQRKLSFIVEHPIYQAGDQVKLRLHVLDAQLISQLPDQLNVDIVRPSDGQLIGRESLIRQEGHQDLFLASFTAQQPGKLQARLNSVAPGMADLTLPINISAPGGEMDDPRVDRSLLSKLADNTSGQTVQYSRARELLPKIIPSLAREVEDPPSRRPLWTAPLAMLLFVLLITGEWVLRKVYGML